jgi:hypothetical protein
VHHGEFELLLQRLADAWNRGDPAGAVACFTNDAVYLEPPDRQLFTGRDALWAFFGGDNPPVMRMTWHHIVWGGEVGFGEYTFSGTRHYHGIVIVRCRNGLIDRWREYQYESDVPWESFIGTSRFA